MDRFYIYVVFVFQIVMDNKAHSGKVKIWLESRATIKECKDPSVSGQGEGIHPAIQPSS